MVREDAQFVLVPTLEKLWAAMAQFQWQDLAGSGALVCQEIRAISSYPSPSDGFCLASPRNDVFNLSIATLQISGLSASAAITCAALRRRRTDLR
jgi:hypothetical protein